MERYTMFLDWKNQYCENDYTTQSNLQIQCNPYQTTNGIFHRTGTNNFTICMETQKPLNSQSNPEKEKRSCMYFFELEFSLDIYPGVGLLDRMVALFLIF